MSKITLNFEVSGQQKKNGIFTIYLRATENCRHFKLALEVYVLNSKNFNAQAKKECWINSKEPYSKVFNAKLSNTLALSYKIMAELERKEELSAQNLIKQLKGGNSYESFIAFLENKQQEFIDKRQYNYSMSILYLKQKLEMYNKNRDVLFHDLTYSFVSGFVVFLSKDGRINKGHLQDSSVHLIISRFKMLYKLAVLEEYITMHNNPFDKIKVKKYQVKKTALTLAEVESIRALDLKVSSSIWHTRNYFLFSIYMAGIRIGDVMNLQWKNIDLKNSRLSYTMQKTKSHQSVMIHKKAQEILNFYQVEESEDYDYIFPILTMYEKYKYKKQNSNLTDKIRYYRMKSRTAEMNRQLKKMAKKAGITKNISFHIARHTFANVASLSDIGVYNISQLLGHTNVSITQNYLNDLNGSVQDKCLRKIFK